MKTSTIPSQNFLGIAAAILAITFLPTIGHAEETSREAPKANVSASPAGDPTITWNPESGQAVLTNGRLELVVETKAGINARSLRDVKSDQLFADGDYEWSGGGFPKIDGDPVIADSKDGGRSITFKGRLGSIAIEQVFTLPKNDRGVILEQVTIGNPTDKPLETAAFHCGFAKLMRRGETWTSDASEIHFSPIPYRRETNGQMQVFPLLEVAEHGSSYAGWCQPAVPTPIWGAEGWVWSFHSPRPLGEGPGVRADRNASPHPNPLPKGEGTSTFLLAKFNQKGMEWSLMEPIKRGTETVLRFGGAGQWKYNHPEGATRLEPGKSYQFGETRLQAVDGDWKQAYYAYRNYVNDKGCGVPKDYNPPVQWNELYDNEYFFKAAGLGVGPSGHSPEFYENLQKLLNQYYTLDLMKAEAAKAKDLGCEVLYMDPGWDTGKRGGLHVWDAARLGPMKTYVEMIKKDYGFWGIGLWCSLAGVPPTYCDAHAYPTAQVLSKDGKKEDFLICHACPGFLDAKEKLLLELCRNGAVFLMFDSDQYSGPCYDKTHGHGIPSTREEHAKATFELARRIKAKYPNVLIELHDPITGPSSVHYTPTYFGYCPPTSFDCLWGHEFMWDSMGDLLSGRAVSLYYYNLSYSIPLYLHISLKQDNENALLFWWYASMCRHLGLGGKPGPAAWEADKLAMKTYLPLKRFFAQGVFYGIDEMVHAHTLPELRASVLNVFNLEDKPAQKRVQFRLAEIGLPTGPVQIEGAAFQQREDEITLDLTIPARGHQLLKVQSQGEKAELNQSK